MTMGDRRSRFFLKVLKAKESKDKIDWVWEDGNNYIKFVDILNAFTQFYKNLFATKDKGEDMKCARDKIKGIILRKLEDSDYAQLEVPIFLV